MKSFQRKIQLIIITLLLIAVYVPLSEAAVNGSFLYNLSDFTGTVPYDWTRVSVDRERNETYVLYQNGIKVFNDSGMEIYHFGDELELGHIVDIAIDKGGNILLLSYTMMPNGEPNYSIHLCNYRGEPKSTIELKNLPDRFAKFAPSRMIYRNGSLYFMSVMGLEIVVTDSDGNFKNGYDLFSLLELEEKDRGSVEISGFSVDKEGNVLFTIAVLFRACILSPNGKLDWFGKPGGAPGRFNVVSGIVRDSKGNYLIADKLKSAVMVFDKKFNFLAQFGYRGSRPGNLIVPDDIAIDDKDRIYVTQARRRGVSVFKIINN